MALSAARITAAEAAAEIESWAPETDNEDLERQAPMLNELERDAENSAAIEAARELADELRRMPLRQAVDSRDYE